MTRLSHHSPNSDRQWIPLGPLATGGTGSNLYGVMLDVASLDVASLEEASLATTEGDVCAKAAMLIDHILTRTDTLRISKKDGTAQRAFGSLPCACDSAIHSEGLLFAGRHARGTRLVTSRSVLIARTWSPNLRSGREASLASLIEEHHAMGAHMNPTNNNRRNSLNSTPYRKIGCDPCGSDLFFGMQGKGESAVVGRAVQDSDSVIGGCNRGIYTPFRAERASVASVP
jgi:hypothetical protein